MLAVYQRINRINHTCALVTLTFENEVRNEEITSFPAKKKEKIITIAEQLLLHAIVTATSQNDQRKNHAHLTKIKRLLNNLESLVMQDSGLTKERSLRDLFSALGELSLTEKTNPVPVTTQGATHYLLQKFGYPPIGSFFDATLEQFFGLAPITTPSNTTTKPIDTNDCPHHTSTANHRAYIEKLFAHVGPEPRPTESVVSVPGPAMFAETTSGNAVTPPTGIHKPTPLRAAAAPFKPGPSPLVI